MNFVNKIIFVCKCFVLKIRLRFKVGLWKLVHEHEVLTGVGANTNVTPSHLTGVGANTNVTPSHLRIKLACLY